MQKRPGMAQLENQLRLSNCRNAIASMYSQLRCSRFKLLSSNHCKKIGCFLKAIFFILFRKQPSLLLNGELSGKPVTPLQLKISMTERSKSTASKPNVKAYPEFEPQWLNKFLFKYEGAIIGND